MKLHIEEFETKYDELLAKLPEKGNCPFHEAEEFAVQFLKAAYEVNIILRRIRNEIIVLDATCNIKYNEVINKCDGKGVTEKKIQTEANPEYLLTVKEQQEMANNKEYFKNLYDIFMAAHIFYKGISREK